MRVFISSNAGHEAKRMMREFPHHIGWLLSPTCWKNPPPNLTYALDNDAYSAWAHHTPWNEANWLSLLRKAKDHPHPPLWALVPDSVANPQETLYKWYLYSPIVIDHGFTPAFAVQDGMSPSDVPKEATVIFVGGTTSWKWKSLPVWTSAFPRVHVGRVRQRKLTLCDEYHAESCDGTGWFREGQTGKPAQYLWAYLRHELHLPHSFPFYHQTANHHSTP